MQPTCRGASSSAKGLLPLNVMIAAAAFPHCLLFASLPWPTLDHPSLLHLTRHPTSQMYNALRRGPAPIPPPHHHQYTTTCTGLSRSRCGSVGAAARNVPVPSAGGCNQPARTTRRLVSRPSHGPVPLPRLQSKLGHRVALTANMLSELRLRSTLPQYTRPRYK
jgi:hypothetical protein